MKTPAFWTHMREYFLDMWGLANNHQDNPKSPLQALLSEVERTTRDALDVQAEKRKSEAEERLLREQRQVIEQESLWLCEDISNLHQQLETGLDRTALSELSDFVRLHWHELGLDRRAEHLAELTLRAVARRLHREALSWGWDEFCRRAEQRQLVWPPPLGVSPHADGEELVRHRAMEQELLKSRFCSGEILRLADLVVGSVPVWGAVFPERGGTVWRHSVFEAVAGAFALLRLREMDKLAHEQRSELEKRLTEALTEPLRKIEDRLRSPFSSLEEDKLLAERAEEICQNQAAELVWQILAPQL